MELFDFCFFTRNRIIAKGYRMPQQRCLYIYVGTFIMFVGSEFRAHSKNSAKYIWIQLYCAPTTPKSPTSPIPWITVAVGAFTRHSRPTLGRGVIATSISYPYECMRANTMGRFNRAPPGWRGWMRIAHTTTPRTHHCARANYMVFWHLENTNTHLASNLLKHTYCRHRVISAPRRKWLCTWIVHSIYRCRS